MGLLVSLLVAVVLVGAVLALRDDTETVVASPTSSPSPIPSSSPSPSASATPPTTSPRRVEQTFHQQEWLKGERLWLTVVDFPREVSGCTVHAYTVEQETLGAYESDCQSWESDGYDVLLFYVGLRNPTNRPVRFNLRNFVVTARDSRTFGPVNVRSQAEFPPNFLPETGKLPPKSNLVGYLTFDGRVTGMVPERLSYLDGQQTLSIVFEGNHSTS
ncbi:MAG: hypothetical protein WD965_07000 [Actinomycetota bacterium]